MSRGLNKVMIIGNVGREPDLRFTTAGKPVTSFSVAVSRRWTDTSGQRREETEWFNIVAWGNLAEICSQLLAKGCQVYVEGRLQTRSWDNEHGYRQYRTDVVASEVTVLDRRAGRNTNAETCSDIDREMDIEIDVDEVLLIHESIS